MNAAAITVVMLMFGLLSAPAAVARKLDDADAAALKQLAQASLAEIESGKLAASKAQSQEVKTYGQKMVDEHQQKLQSLRRLAKSRELALPDTVSLKDFGYRRNLERYSGADFDRRYMEEMVKNHRKDVEETANLAARTKDAELKAALIDANAKSRQHLQLAERIASQTAAAGGSRR